MQSRMKADDAVHALYVHATRKASAAAVEKHLASLKASRTFPGVFVSEAMRQRAGTWEEVLKMLSRVGRQYSIGDKAFMATLKDLQAPAWLASVQAATVSDDAPLVVCAALAHDGSDASHDALLAEFERARTSKDEWALRYKLKRIIRYGTKGPHLDALEAAVARELERRDGAKAERSLAKQLGLNVELLDFYLRVTGTKARQASRVSLIISANDRANFLPTQALGLESPPPRDFLKVRAWLTEVTRKEKVTWAWDEADLKTNLRGKYRTAMVAWLRSERESPLPD